MTAGNGASVDWRKAIAGVALVLVLVAAGWLWPASASSATSERTPLELRTRWSCSPASIFVDEQLPAGVVDVVESWRRQFRPDWTYTSSRTSAAVVVLYQRPPSPGEADGVASIAGTSTTRVHADVYVAPGSGLEQRVARHELGHVAGLEHSADQWDAMGAYSLVDRYSVRELALLAVARRLCLP